MMDMRWMPVVCGLLFAAYAGAEQSGSDPTSEANAANRAAALKSNRISPRQRAELEKAGLINRNAQAGAQAQAGNGPAMSRLASGVQYRILKAGSGRKPTDANSVLCRYTGTLANGAVFDKTDEKAPLQLKVAGLLPGLKEAVKLMPAGSTWEVVVPPQLAYGARGRQGVGPNATLTYRIELVAIQ